MNTEEAWRTWWDVEGKHMERLPHHDAVDHMASVTRIAWLNCAFEAADEIELLRKERDEARREILESLHPDLRKSHADARGWDCLKEATDDR